MTIDLNSIITFLNGLYGVPKVVLTFIACIAAGWMMKRSPWIANDRIPFRVCVVGAVLLPVISDYQSSDIQSVRVFIGTNIVIGFITGALATFAYRVIIKKLLKKLGDGNGENSDPPLPNADGSNVRDAKDRITNPKTLQEVDQPKTP